MEKKDKLNESKEQNNKNISEIKSLFIKEFKKFILSDKDKNKILEEILSKDNIEDSKILKIKLDEFKAYSNNKEIQNFDLSKINIFDLRREVSKEFVALDNTREIYFEYIFKNYELSDKDLDKIQKSEDFKKLEVYDLEKLLKNESNNINFLSSLLKKEIKTKNEISIFNNITDKQIEDRLNKIGSYSPDLAKNLKISLLKIADGKANSEDLKYLFTSGFLNYDEKKQLLEKFVPFLSLGEAKDYGLLEDKELKGYKKNIVEEYIKNLEGIDENIKDKLADSLSLYDILAPSYIFLDKKENLDKIVLNYNFSGVSNTINKELNKHFEDKDNNIDLLKKLGLDINKFKKENIIEIIIPEEDETGKKSSFEESYFFEIKNIYETGVILKDIGKNKDIHYSGESKKFSFFQLSEFLKKQQARAKLYTKKEFKEIISDENSEFDIDSNFKLKNKIENKEDKEKIIDNILENLEEEKKDKEKKLKELESNLGEFSGISEEEKNKKEEQLKREIEGLDLKISNIKEDKISQEELLGEYNFIKFLEELDFIDKQGKKIGFEKGIFIENGKGLFDTKDEGGGSYEILDILKEEGKIKLKGLSGVELVDFENFLKIFKKNKFKRVKKISNFDEIINDKLNDNNWKNVKLENGKLIQKDVEYNGEKKDREVSIFSGNNTDKIVKINNINQDKVKVQFGVIKNLDKEEKIKNKYKEKDDIYNLELGDEVEISLTQLNKYINDFDLYPDWKLGEKKLKKEGAKGLQNNIKGSFSTRLFNKYSISELIAGAKLMVSGIEEYMKKGNDIHAAKFALGLGKILPEEIRADLKIKVEREEAEAMDKAIDSLSKVDSPIATSRIKKWLLNKDTPEYKKEAGLMFMLQKYGVLYAKELTEYQGKFLWYEAFGGRIGDELYNSVKEEAERNNVPFSEEKLMHMLLKKQCKGILKPERRSRLHKDYEGKWKNGVKEEVEKGYSDASKKRNATEMVKGGMDEAFGGTIPNSLGWFKKAVERGDSPEVMSEGFFSLMYSGVLAQQEENLLTEYIKPLWDRDGFPIIMIRFATTKGDLDFFNNVILELSKRIQETDSKNFPNIYNEAKEIYDEVKSGKGTEKQRLRKTQDFWKKYGKPLSRALHFQDIGESETSKTDKIILIEKDNNPIFNKYYNTVRAFTGIGGAFNKELMDDESGEHGLAGLNHNEIIKRYFRMDSGRSIPSSNISVVERLWRKLSEDINSINKKNMEIRGGDDIENKKKYLKLILRDIFAGFITNHPERMFLKKYVEASPFKDDMKKWGVTEDVISKFLNYSSGEILAGTRGSDEIIDEIIENILFGNGENNKENNPIFSTIDEIKEGIEGSIEKTQE